MLLELNILELFLLTLRHLSAAIRVETRLELPQIQAKL